MRKLMSLFSALLMMLSMVFISEAISTSNPYAVQAQQVRHDVDVFLVAQRRRLVLGHPLANVRVELTQRLSSPRRLEGRARV